MTGATAARLRATVISVAATVVLCIFAGLAGNLLGAPPIVHLVGGGAIGWRVSRRIMRWAERDAA